MGRATDEKESMENQWGICADFDPRGRSALFKMNLKHV